jgi:hypothetical protein
VDPLEFTPDRHREALMRLRSLLLLCFVTGCGLGEMSLESMVPADADRLSRDYVALIARGEVDSAELMLPAEIPHDSARVLLRIMADSLGGTSIDSAPMLGFNVSTNTADGVERTTSRLTYQIPMRNRWMLVTVNSSLASGAKQITGFSFQVLEQDLRVLNAFTWSGKPAGQYLWLAVGIAMMLIAFGCSGWVAMQKGFPKRFLWAFVALIGVGSSFLDWTSGEMGSKVFHWILFCFGATKGGPASPWLFSFAFPAGAFLAVSRVRKWRADGQRAKASAAPPPPVADAPVP